MKKKVILFVMLSLFFVGFVSAAQHTITVRGEPRKPDGSFDYIVDAGVYGGQGKITANVEINNDEGYFIIRDHTFDDTILVGELPVSNSVNIGASGWCFNHAYFIKWQNNRYEVFDSYNPDGGLVYSTSDDYIDLGVLKEDKSTPITVDSDIPVSFQVFDLDENEVAYNIGFEKTNGMSDVFKSNSKYKIVLESESGKKWETEATTGDYCEGTRIIKRGDYFEEAYFPENVIEPIGFFKGIKLWFKGLFS